MLESVTRALSSTRFRFATERELCDGLAQAFASHAIPFSREHHLGTDRLDFLIGSLAIEVKTKGGLPPLLRQLTRYASHAEVCGLLVVTARIQLSSLPTHILEKPLHVCSLIGSLL